jgi:hypothetical protein
MGREAGKQGEIGKQEQKGGEKNATGGVGLKNQKGANHKSERNQQIKEQGQLGPDESQKHILATTFLDME